MKIILLYWFKYLILKNIFFAEATFLVVSIIHVHVFKKLSMNLILNHSSTRLYPASSLVNSSNLTVLGSSFISFASLGLGFKGLCDQRRDSVEKKLERLNLNFKRHCLWIHQIKLPCGKNSRRPLQKNKMRKVQSCILM